MKFPFFGNENQFWNGIGQIVFFSRFKTFQKFQAKIHYQPFSNIPFFFMNLYVGIQKRILYFKRISQFRHTRNI